MDKAGEQPWHFEPRSEWIFSRERVCGSKPRLSHHTIGTVDLSANSRCTFLPLSSWHCTELRHCGFGKGQQNWGHIQDTGWWCFGPFMEGFLLPTHCVHQPKRPQPSTEREHVSWDVPRHSWEAAVEEDVCYVCYDLKYSQHESESIHWKVHFSNKSEDTHWHRLIEKYIFLLHNTLVHNASFFLYAWSWFKRCSVK